MNPVTVQSQVPPQQFGDYRVERALTPGQSFLCVSSTGRKLVLKALEEDCLLRGRLHPSIADRLKRVCELAHPGVANLHGVERFRRDPSPTCGEGTYLVWEYVEGKPADEYVAGMTSPAELAVLAREIAVAVESLHALGIVHGQIHAGNVIIDGCGRVRLTHVSPLLYDDPANDVHDTVAMLEHLIAKRPEWRDSATSRAIAAAAADIPPLPQLRAMLAESNEAPGANETTSSISPPNTHRREDRSFRRRAILAALLVALVGAAITSAVVVVTVKHSPAIPPPPEASAKGTVQTR